MFEVGERVVCIVDDWPEEDWHCVGVPFPLVKGRIYLVVACYPTGTVLPCKSRFLSDSIGIGVENEALRKAAKSIGGAMTTYDVWVAHAFRRIHKLDTSEALAALKRLAVGEPVKAS